MNLTRATVVFGLLISLASFLPHASSEDPSERVATMRFQHDLKLAPQRLQNLSSAIQGLTGDEILNVIQSEFGKAARNIGSGSRILQWDLSEGVLTHSPCCGNPSFQLTSGRSFSLVRTRSTVSRSIVRDHEMVTLPLPKESGMTAWIGVLSLSPNRAYKFVDSGTNLDYRAGQADNFFMRHPQGKYSISYTLGIGPKTQLESLAERLVIASVKFSAIGSETEIEFNVLNSPDAMLAEFVGPVGQPFILR